MSERAERTPGSASDDPSIPFRIGEYRVRRELGRGGIGVVYLADDPRLGRSVALKVLRRDRESGPRTAARFEREAKILARLRHPYLVQVHDVFLEENGGGPRTVVVMEYVEGRTLDRILEREGPLETSRATTLLGEILEGLAAAHARGIVHRDLKLANVILAADGHVKILDFGLAKPTVEPRSGDRSTETWPDSTPGQLQDSSATLPETFQSETGAVLGTRSSMAPEQARGLPIDERADLFALGVLAYALLTGRRPFRGETPEDLLVRICGERQVPVNELRPELPRWLAEWVDRLLEKSPDDRPRNALEALDALRSAGDRADRAVTAPAPTMAPRSPGGLGRRWRPFALGVLVVGLALVVLRVPGPDGSPSLAVLEPRDLAPRRATSWWGTALAESLAASLARSPDLRVLEPSWIASTRRSLELPSDGELVSALGADYVLDGTYQTVGEASDTVELSLRLSRRDEGTIVWSGEAVVPADGLWSVREELVGPVLRALATERPPAGHLEALELGFPMTPEASRAYAEGVAALRAFELARAAERLERALALDPGSPRIVSALAQLRALQGRTGEALELVERALGVSRALPTRDRLLLGARKAALAQERDGAVDAYARLVAVEPDNLDLGLRLAEAQRLAGQLEDARSTVDRLRTLPVAEDDPRLWLLSARVSWSAGELRRMLAEAETAERAADAWHASALASLASLYQAIAHSLLGDTVASTAAAARAADTRLDAGSSSVELADLQLLEHEVNEAARRGDLAVAEALYRSVFESYRSLGNAAGMFRSAQNRGAALSLAGRHEEALEAFREAAEQLEVGGGAVSAAVLRSQMANEAMFAGEYERAAAEYEALRDAFRDLGQARFETLTIANLAEALFHLDRLEESERLFEEARRRKILDATPDAYELHYLGRIAARRGELLTAGDRYREALETADAAGDRLTRAQIHLSQAELALVRDQSDEALRLSRLAREAAEAGGFGIERAAALELEARILGGDTASDERP